MLQHMRLKPNICQQLTSSALFSSSLEVAFLWNRKPISWWITVTLQLSDVNTSYNRINLGMWKNSNHLLLLCSCSTLLIHFVSTSRVMNTCHIERKQRHKYTKQMKVWLLSNACTELLVDSTSNSKCYICIYCHCFNCVLILCQTAKSQIGNFQ